MCHQLAVSYSHYTRSLTNEHQRDEGLLLAQSVLGCFSVVNLVSKKLPKAYKIIILQFLTGSCSVLLFSMCLWVMSCNLELTLLLSSYEPQPFQVSGQLFTWWTKFLSLLKESKLYAFTESFPGSNLIAGDLIWLNTDVLPEYLSKDVPASDFLLFNIRSVFFSDVVNNNKSDYKYGNSGKWINMLVVEHKWKDADGGKSKYF